MKWLMICAIFCFMMLLSGCDSSKTSYPISSEPIPTYDASKNVKIIEVPATIDEIDFNLIMSGNGQSMVLSKLGIAEKQAIIAEGKAQGVTVIFDNDGNSSFVNDADGSKAIQDAQGYWTIVTKEGTVGQIGGKWTENEFTKQLPQPNMQIAMSVNDDTSFSVTFANPTLDEIKSYVEQLKADGFTNDQVLTDMQVKGVNVYAFQAVNENNYSVEVILSNGVASLIISKNTD